MSKHMKGIIYATITSTLYGLSFMVTKGATDSLGVFELLGPRFLLALVVMMLLKITGVIKLTITKEKLLSYLPVTLIFPLTYFISETYGIMMTTAGESGIIIASIPLVTLLISSVVSKAIPKRNEVIGIIMTLIGLLMIVLSAGLSVSLNLPGYLLLFVAVLSYAMYTILVFSKTSVTATEKTFLSILTSTVVFVILGFFESGSLLNFIRPFRELNFLVPILYLGLLSTVVAFFFNMLSIEHLGASRAASFEGLTTFVSIISGVLFLKEPFGLYQGISALLIIAGIIIANLEPRKVKNKSITL